MYLSPQLKALVCTCRLSCRALAREVRRLSPGEETPFLRTLEKSRSQTVCIDLYIPSSVFCSGLVVN